MTDNVKRLFDGATKETHVPPSIDLEVRVYSAATTLARQAACERLTALGFVKAAKAGNFEPRIMNVSGDPLKAIGMFSGFSEPVKVIAEAMSLSSGKDALLCITQRVPYTQTSETDDEDTSDLEFGATISVMPHVMKDGQLDIRCSRWLSRTATGDEIGPELVRSPSVSTNASSDGKGYLGPTDAFVHAEFVGAAEPTPEVAGEIIITVVTGKVAEGRILAG
jgi:hypothetical protein